MTRSQRFLAAALLAVPMITTAGPPDPLQSLVEAERAFARAAADKGVRAAFLQYLADEAVVFRPQAVEARRWYLNYPESEAGLAWEPAFAEVSRSGDLGYTLGPWTYRPSLRDSIQAYGHYVTVWRRQADGAWKAVADIGVPHPPQAGPATLSLRPPAPAPEGDSLALADAFTRRQALLDAERDFFARAAVEGMQAAYREFADPDLRLLRSESPPAQGLPAALDLLSPGYLTGFPDFAEVAWTADLGYAYGTGLLRRTRTEEETAGRYSYLRVWRRETGAWKIALDVTIPAEPAKKTSP
ncbi:MAG: nuclear transport factor 2 family protein [Candidatus Zixiibacteriota bacterium]|nr:MAG: nuclear transport factor 2 family protein [candidate division Zixibacteria bacterium]